jgi:Protein of unknown function (DUF2914)/Tetratricopeptide repeat
MPEPREHRSIVEAAERAAASGDYVSAEQLLREAARLQEAGLGPMHPDLANTLNNLGVVCEITKKPDDAELCYRRAYAIAAAVLDPDHPFVATSHKNLLDFCEAQGRPVESRNPPQAAAAEPARPPSPASSVAPERPPDRESRRPAATRPLVIGALGVGALVVAMLFAIRPWRPSEGPLPRSSAPAPEAVPVAPISVPTGSPANTATAQSRAVETPITPIPGMPTVAVAQLCTELSTGGSASAPGAWRCHPPSFPVGPGRLFFYTRVKSPRDITVQHRWLRGDDLRQAVELRIRPNPTDGYRTYSRQTVDNRGVGDWRVELRTQDGILLHEERFVVR